MKGNILVTVIVPVYNVEQYIRKCVNSIVNQTYNNLEIILINDGSKDQSGVICDELSILDNRIKVYHKSNGGLSDARNYGLNQSTGEYILFLDSDDYIQLDAVEKLLKYAVTEELDIICGDICKTIYQNNNSENGNSEESIILYGGASVEYVMSGEEYLVDCIKKKKYSSAACTRMYRAELIKKNKIYFIKDLFHEDEEWTPRILLAAKRIGYLNYIFYNYIIRENSITQQKDKSKHIKDILGICGRLETHFNSFVNSGKNKNILNDYLAKLYINTCTYGDIDKKYYTKLINKKFPLKNAFYIKTKLQVVLYCINTALFRQVKKYL